MNVLILTPDAVGSTLLQRLLTIYMQFHNFGQPVINTHELTNGIEKFWSTEFNRELLGKHKNTTWGYHQSLEEITELLQSVDHYKTSRLAQYHIKNRQDSLEKQVPFYRYLNDNFFIISGRRRNLFEHALSMCLTKIHKKLNVYSSQEKISTFIDIYQNPVDIDPESLINTLNDYRSYLDWAENYFSVASYFYYDQHVENIEKYILGLPVFASQQQLVTWKSTFGQEFNDWNRCHYMMADLGTVMLEQTNPSPKLLTIEENKLSSEFGMINYEAKRIVSNLPVAHQAFLKTHIDNYLTAHNSIDRMIELGIMTTGVPMKKQTMTEKKHIVKNFTVCVETYNRWADAYPDIAQPINFDEIAEREKQEQKFWNPSMTLTTTPTVTLIEN